MTVPYTQNTFAVSLPVLLSDSTFSISIDAITSLNTRNGATQQFSYRVGNKCCFKILMNTVPLLWNDTDITDSEFSGVNISWTTAAVTTPSMCGDSSRMCTSNCSLNTNHFLLNASNLWYLCWFHYTTDHLRLEISMFVKESANIEFGVAINDTWGKISTWSTSFSAPSNKWYIRIRVILDLQGFIFQSLLQTKPL